MNDDFIKNLLKSDPYQAKAPVGEWEAIEQRIHRRRQWFNFRLPALAGSMVLILVLNFSLLSRQSNGIDEVFIDYLEDEAAYFADIESDFPDLLP